MIYTRFGGKIRIIEYLGRGYCEVETEEKEIRQWHMEFADNLYINAVVRRLI